MRNQYYQGPLSDHFDGARFFHPGLPASDKSLLDLLKWTFSRKPTPWPARVPAKVGVRPADRVAGLQITHIGHASYLVQTDGYNILLDPIWSERASPVKWAGPRRFNPPAIAFEHLPAIDAVLVTHNHYDHLDTATLQRLWVAHHPQLFAPLGNDAVIRVAVPDVEVQTGDWWDSFALTEHIRLTIVPSYHWSSRGVRDRRMALWGGFILQTPAGVIYCAGDTAYRDGAIFPEMGKRFGPPVVAVLPIGAYGPRWFMQTQHADPRDAVQIALACGAKHVLGVHWGTFPLTDEPWDEPPCLLAEAAQKHSSGDVLFEAMRPGDLWTGS